MLRMVEGSEVNVLGIPGNDNRWFPGQGQARMAALEAAMRLGLGYRIAHHSRPRIGLPHYHLAYPDGRPLERTHPAYRHFFYGRRPPRRVYRGRPWREFEYDLATLTNPRQGLAKDQPEYFWPTVLRVAAVGARGAAPLFRVIGRALSPAAARTAARRLPGVFVRGKSAQVKQFARQVGGRLVGPERHGAGLPHYHVIRPGGDRIHVWFGQRIPRGDFFE